MFTPAAVIAFSITVPAEKNKGKGGFVKLSSKNRIFPSICQFKKLWEKGVSRTHKDLREILFNCGMVKKRPV